MGLDIHVWFIDWIRFTLAVKNGTFLKLFEEVREPEPEWCQLYLPNDLIDNYFVGVEASELYDVIRDKLNHKHQKICDSFFGAFFWRISENSNNDLELTKDELQTFPISIAPERKSKLLTICESVPMTELESLFDEVRVQNQLHYFYDLEFFDRYLLQWPRLLKHSLKTDCGILISLA